MSEEPKASPEERVAGVSGARLQDVILKLQRFWADRDCMLLPACDFTVPFATLHPDAFFGVLAPGPWRAVFLQPVRRPLDGRYGEHPYRLGKHLQLQVVLKPAPADVQGLYLESLEALGLELAHHDVRFSDWSWAPRSIGGRGSGWHALLDGLGVTRLTFLERLADRDLAPPHIEITYGLERLAMTLQGTESAFQLGWSEASGNYGDLRLRDENELTRYAFEIADPEVLGHRIDLLEKEAERCLESDLARAAYELSVRCLEPIDQLEARKKLSARERQDQLDRVRRRVVAAAEIVDRQRESDKSREEARAPGRAEKAKAGATKKPRRRVKRSRAKRKASGDGGKE